MSEERSWAEEAVALGRGGEDTEAEEPRPRRAARPPWRPPSRPRLERRAAALALAGCCAGVLGTLVLAGQGGGKAEAPSRVATPAPVTISEPARSRRGEGFGWRPHSEGEKAKAARSPRREERDPGRAALHEAPVPAVPEATTYEASAPSLEPAPEAAVAPASPPPPTPPGVEFGM